MLRRLCWLAVFGSQLALNLLFRTPDPQAPGTVYASSLQEPLLVLLELTTDFRPVKQPSAGGHMHGPTGRPLRPPPSHRPAAVRDATHARRRVDDERRHRKERLAGACASSGGSASRTACSGHITARDPEYSDCFWVNPFGMPFRHVTVSDLVLANSDGQVIEGRYHVNQAAFTVHAQVHAARPTSSPWPTATRSRPRPVRPRRPPRPDHPGELRLLRGPRPLRRLHRSRRRRRGGPAYRVRARLPQGARAAQPRLLTVGDSVDAAAWWFLSMERSSQVQLTAKGGGPAHPDRPPTGGRRPGNSSAATWWHGSTTSRCGRTSAGAKTRPSSGTGSPGGAEAGGRRSRAAGSAAQKPRRTAALVVANSSSVSTPPGAARPTPAAAQEYVVVVGRGRDGGRRVPPGAPTGVPPPLRADGVRETGGDRGRHERREQVAARAAPQVQGVRVLLRAAASRTPSRGSRSAGSRPRSRSWAATRPGRDRRRR